ncbi:MAG: caspase family protein [Verrucomicrobiaceae bacterium]
MKRPPLARFVASTLFLLATESTLAANHALLVGVSEYPSLDRSQWLVGPVNDVALAKEVLTGDRFQFPEKNITTLAGWPKEAEARPTRDNIAKAFENLATKAQKDDVVFILMSGHGSQQPANDDKDDIETDGLDEIFLPADTTVWNPEKKTIEGAIIDDEIKVWTNKIRNKGALVWIIFDSCHSGTMTRGTEQTGRVNRRIDPALLIPKAVSTSPSLKVPATRSETSGEYAKTSPASKGKLIAMYAAQSLEPTFELPMPPPHGPRRGLFSTTILEIIAGAPGALTYRDLAETVDVVYRSNGILQPTPLMEGDGLDLPVLGIGKAPKRHEVLFTGMQGPKGLQINSGHLRGITKGTILEVFPPAVTNSEQSLGTVKVTHVEATGSFVIPHEFGEMKKAILTDLSAACRASIIYRELGLSTMKVAIQKRNDDNQWLTLKLDENDTPSQPVINTLQKNSKGLYELTSDAGTADWIIQLNEASEGKLLPACGNQTNEKTTFLSAESIIKNLGKISRARQLLNIAGRGTGDSSLRIKVDLVRFDPPGSDNGTIVSHEASGRTLNAGDEIAFRISNSSPVAADVTLLHVDQSFAISAVFPEPATTDDNRIPAGGRLDTPRLVVTADQPLKEQLVVLATRATRERHSFTALEQEALEVSRGASMQSPLGKLLSSKMYGKETTRGLTRAETGNYATRLLTWTSLPSEE